ncbi:hypothetical protein BGX34_001822 [Mortierella sp. NVP85]|nr:hypothetical protein BGX34_001822 [Mortierella sp. NVP85]
MDDDLGPNGSHHTAQQSSAQPQVKKEAMSEQEPVKIQSARGTPKGPLPIQVQISLLSSVLKHDPFNCAIRKTTQAWELISKEQGIRARTCSRRFDNIIQASIGGRDRPVGTEEQQATKKKLLEKLFEMMNQPQALKRMQKKRRYRSEDTDRRLLLETIRLNPFAQKVGQVAKAWEDVRDALDMKVHARQCIRRVNRMVKPYLLRERMYKGNIPEEMREANDDLVKQVIQLMRMAGQGNALGDNSDDEDSASGMSDSEEHDDPDNDSKGHDNAQEDDELEDDEDEDMASPGGSEQRNARKSQGGSQRSATSPSTPTQSTTPSASMSGSGPSSTSATPAKRGRPRNPTSSQPGQPPSPNSIDRMTQASAHNSDVHMKDMPQLHRSWEGDADLKSRRPYINGGPEGKAGDDISFTAHGSRPDSPMNSPTAGPQAPGHARHYSNGAEPNDYKRPNKHARTDSRSIHEVSTRLDSARAPSPGGNRHSAYTQHGRDRDEPGYRYGPYADRAFAADTHGHPVHSSDPLGKYDRRGYRTAPEKTSDSIGLPAPTAQQYRDAMNELHIMRDCLAQMEDQWRAEREKQGSMMSMIEKLQHQMQQQQQHLSQLQHQLRFGYSSQQPPQQSSHHSQGPSGPPSSRYPSYPSDHPGFTKNMEGRLMDRHESEATQYHVSYSRSEGQYPVRDRDSR